MTLLEKSWIANQKNWLIYLTWTIKPNYYGTNANYQGSWIVLHIDISDHSFVYACIKVSLLKVEIIKNIILRTLLITYTWNWTKWIEPYRWPKFTFGQFRTKFNIVSDFHALIKIRKTKSVYAPPPPPNRSRNTFSKKVKSG